MSRCSDVDKPYLLMGEVNEKIFLEDLKKEFGYDLYKNKAYWSVIDFGSRINKCSVEMKSRTCQYKSFDNTMFGANKLTYAWNGIKTYGKRFFFVFAFTDGLYSWELTKENYELAGGDKMIYLDGTSERGVEDYKMHFHIPIEQLKCISNKPSYVPPELQQKKEKYDTQKNPAYKSVNSSQAYDPKVWCKALKERKCLIDLTEV